MPGASFGGMAGPGAGAEQGPPAAEEAGPPVPGDPEWRDWAGGVPVDVLAKVAVTFLVNSGHGGGEGHSLFTRV